MRTRPYQNDALDASVQDASIDINSQVLVMPTGSGKTEVGARLPEWHHMTPFEQLLWLVPLDELAWQAKDKFELVNPHLTVDIEKAEYKADPSADIIIASVQSLGRKDGKRLKKFNPDTITKIVIDECDGSVCESYATILRYMNALKGERNRDPSKLLVGITATPDRADGRGLEHIFDKVSYEIGIRKLMETGIQINGSLYPYLARPRCHRVNTQVDISNVKTRGGDFSEKELAHALDTPERNRLIVKSYIELGERMPAIAFSVNVDHARSLVSTFSEFSIPAAAIDGTMARNERRVYYDAYRRGEIKVLVSCMALSVGFDQPMASVALMCRPTKSGRLFKQQLGRVLRPFPAPETYEDMSRSGQRPDWIKPYAIVIDFSDLTAKHSVEGAASLFGLAPDFDAKGEDMITAVEKVEAIIAKQPMLDLKAAKSVDDLKAMVDTIDIFRAPIVRQDVRKLSKFAWLEAFAGVIQLPIGKSLLEIRENTLGEAELWQSVDGRRASLGKYPSLPLALQEADKKVPRDQEILVNSKAKWRKDPPTEAQCRALWRENPEVKKSHSTGLAFYAHAFKGYESGNANYSKGAISAMLSRALTQKGTATVTP